MTRPPGLRPVMLTMGRRSLLAPGSKKSSTRPLPPTWMVSALGRKSWVHLLWEAAWWAVS